MEKSKIGLLAGGAAITIGGLIAYFYTKKEQPVAYKIPKQVIINLCKELKKQMFNISLQIIETRARLLKQLDLGASLPPNLSFEDYIAEIAQTYIENIKKLLCAKFEISLQDFTHAVEIDFVNDSQLQQISNEIEEIFSNSCQGIPPNMDVDQSVLNRFSKEKIYNIHTKFFKIVAKKYIKAFQELKEEGEVDMKLENPKFFKKNRELQIPETKRELLVNEGLDQCPGSPREIFDKITIQYRREDPIFAQKVQEIEKTFQQLIDDLSVQPFKYNDQSPEVLFKEY
ncbi:hypothetical protein ABPG72_001551 [Tetrahymena utriculariae]